MFELIRDVYLQIDSSLSRKAETFSGKYDRRKWLLVWMQFGSLIFELLAAVNLVWLVYRYFHGATQSILLIQAGTVLVSILPVMFSIHLFDHANWYFKERFYDR